MKSLIVTDNTRRLQGEISGVEVISSDRFLADSSYQDSHIRVFNLCRSYSYQSSGYYVSLLASARGQKIVPSIESILDMSSRHFIKLRSEEIDDLIQKNLKSLQTSEFELSLYFGRNTARRYDRLANELHKTFNAPLVRAKFKRKDKWRLHSLSPIGLIDVPESHLGILTEYATDYFRKRQSRRRIKVARFDLAILHDPDEEHPPSNEKALAHFVTAANKLEIDVDFITKEDFHRIAEFDGLFIRETTEVNHHTFRFAHKAQSLGLVVIDDPLSILRCTNKVYMAELFLRNKIPSPKTDLLYRKDTKKLNDIVFPAVVKIPDSSFSRGVVKVANREELDKMLAKMFQDSDIVITQEFIRTEYDWRIGVLNGHAIYAAKYHMAQNHWQIYNHDGDGGVEPGEAEALSLNEVPKAVVDLAVKASRLIGLGLYGVDIKEKDGKLFVIEVNDNPSIDGGIEDEVLKHSLYETIMLYLRDRMEKVAMGRTL